jgi:hypothetical protein
MNTDTVVADYDDEQNKPGTRRGRFVAPIADVSALAGFSDTSLNLLKLIVGFISG